MRYILGLGSNLGSRQAQLDASLQLLCARTGARVQRVSPYYESDSLLPGQPRYLNAAASIECGLGASELLGALHAIETSLGRRRELEQRWGARTLDLDILWAQQPSSAPACVPHPRLRERWFALRPLLCVAPELESQYGPALRALSPEPLAIPARARAQLHEQRAGLELEVIGHDRHDALAALLGALGRHADASPPTNDLGVQPLHGACLPGQELEAVLDAVLTHLDHGASYACAAVAELDAGRFLVHLLTTHGSRTKRAPLRRASVSETVGSLRVRLERALGH